MAVECSKAGIACDLIVVDDGSTDGTPEIVEEMAQTRPVRLIRRPGKMGISSAVIDGFKVAKAPIVGCVDSDLSHPPELVSRLLDPISSGQADMSIATRYIEGGGISGWPLRRRVISRTASLLSRPITSAKDPMSGFFLVKRDLLDLSRLNPRGWKICLEVLVKARPPSVAEVPYTFVNRSRGSSKMGLDTVGGFIGNLADLYAFKFFGSSLASFARFCVVGGIGVLLNLVIYALLIYSAGLWYMAAATITFFIVALNNFFWNKVWTFGDRRKGYRVVGSQLSKFVVASLAALAVNLVVLNALVELLGFSKVLAQVGAIAVAVLVNFGLSSRWVFREAGHA